MSAPTLYHVDGFGAFNGETSPARRSPADKDEVWLIPEAATTEAPPAVEVGEVAVLRDGGWSVLPDRRGQTIYDTATRDAAVIEAPGAIPVGFTTLEPSSPHDTWSGSAWELLPENVPVPAVITAGRMLIELDARGLLEEVDAAVEQASGLTKRLWDRAPTFERADPLVIGIATALGRDAAWLDDFFRAAAKR